MKIAIVQQPTFMGSREDLRRTLLEHDAAFTADKAELVVYPPTFFGASLGYPSDFSSDYTGGLQGWLTEIAQLLTLPTLFLIYLANSENGVIDCALLSAGEVRMLLTGDALENEDDEVEEFDSTVIQLAIGEQDIGLVFNGDMLEPYRAGVVNTDILLLLPMTGFIWGNDATHGYFGAHSTALTKLAHDCNTWIVYANGVGTIEQTVFIGGSFVLNPAGTVTHKLSAFQAVNELVEVGTQPPYQAEDLVPAKARSEQSCENMLGAQTLSCALESYTQQAQKEGIHVLLTGDLSTSLLAVLAVDALGPQKVFATLLCQGDPAKEKIAREVVEHLHIECEEISALDLHRAASALGIALQYSEITLARARANGLAVQQNYLSVSATDKTSYLLGQDIDGLACCDIALFVDIFKSDIANVAHARNELSAVIPASAFDEVGLNLPPDIVQICSLLRVSRSSARMVDEVLSAYITMNLPEEVVLAGLPDLKPLVHTVLEKYRSSELWRRATPLSLDISPLSQQERFLPIVGPWHHYDATKLDPQDALSAAASAAKQVMERMKRAIEAATNEVSQQQLSDAEAEQAASFLENLSQLNLGGSEIQGFGPDILSEN